MAQCLICICKLLSFVFDTYLIRTIAGEKTCKSRAKVRWRYVTYNNFVDELRNVQKQPMSRPDCITCAEESWSHAAK